MALLEQWRTYAEEQQSGPQGPQFWKDYFDRETEIYKRILESKPRKNTVKGYAEKYGVDLMTMVAFLDGINDSLKEQNPLETMEEDTEVNLNYDKELLYKTWWKPRLNGCTPCPSGTTCSPGSGAKSFTKNKSSPKPW